MDKPWCIIADWRSPVDSYGSLVAGCLNICKIEIPEKYYNRTYEYLIKFENVDNHQIIELYVEEYDAKELYINDEYLITHDGIVVFNIYKTMF